MIFLTFEFSNNIVIEVFSSELELDNALKNTKFRLIYLNGKWNVVKWEEENQCIDDNFVLQDFLNVKINFWTWYFIDG